MDSLNCLKCNAPLRETDFNSELGVAKCGYCEAWIKIDDLKQPVGPQNRIKSLEEIPRPEHIQIDESRRELVITVKWPTAIKSVSKIGFGIFSVVPVLFCLLMAVFILTSPLPSFVAIFPLLIGAASVFGFTKFKSMVTRFTQDRVVRVEPRGNFHCSLPIFGKREEVLPSMEVKQLYSTEHQQHHSDSEAIREFATFYNVNVLLRDNSTHVVCSGLKSLQEAILIERTIEDYLGIVDNNVPGEAGVS